MKSKMVRRYVGLVAVSGLLAMGGANLYAQEDQESSKQESQKSEQQQQSKDSQQKQQGRAEEASKDELKVSQEQLSKNVTDANKASKIIGMQVKNMQNEDLGKVKELVIDNKSGKVAYAVLSAGGGLLGGGKLVAVPFEALSLQPGAKNMVMNMKKDEFKSAKGFAENSWPNLDAVKTGQTVGIASQGQQQQQQGGQEQAVGGTGSSSQKEQGSSQSSTNQPSSGSSEPPKGQEQGSGASDDASKEKSSGSSSDDSKSEEKSSESDSGSSDSAK